MTRAPRTRTETTLLYVVYWQKERVLKLGRANHIGRVRRHLKAGATPLVIIEHRSWDDEKRALTALAQHFDYAFDQWRDATSLLGPNGSGYSECFAVGPAFVPNAIDVALKAVARG